MTQHKRHQPDWVDDPLWYKDAIIYQLHVKAFFDSNNDGVGDFRGLTQKLDYIHSLGVNCLWLLPFYVSPMRDDGYDISDYRSIYPAYGSRKDFRLLMREAHRRGLRVITELVINHTSDQHPWFQAARRAPPGSAKRNYYVWSDTDKKFPETRIIFTDYETSNWTWDPTAQAYYWHRFFSHQPDLNHNNLQVVKAVIREMRFWLNLGVDGLRLDAIPYLCVREGTNNENIPETHAVIKQMRATVDAHYKNRMFLAEANQWPEDVREYFGEGDECHMAYHFPLMPRMYMAVAQEDRHPIVEIMEQTPEIPATAQWAIFLRNHDELTLEMVTDRERDYMYETYAGDRRMRLNVGIRRRMAPLMDNDSDRIKLMNSLLMSMPGSPIVYYGDEIGMGDNVYLGDRDGVRTPMQWSPDRNAGFSRADPQRLYLPPIMDAIYGYGAVNVEAQSRDPSSFLSWMKRLIAVRKAHQVFGRGTLEFLRPGNRKILAYLRAYDDETVLCVANLSRSAQPVELDLAHFKGRIPLELMGHTPFPPIGELPYLLTLPGHGVFWFRLAQEIEAPAWHEEHSSPLELRVLVLFNGWQSFFPEQVELSRRPYAQKLHAQFEHEVLPMFLQVQRWFAGKGKELAGVFLRDCMEWTVSQGSWLLAHVDALFRGEVASQTYFLPLSLAWGEGEEVRQVMPFSLAKVRQRARVGVLYDAFADERFCQALVEAIGRNLELPTADGGRLVFSATAAFAQVVGASGAALPARRPGAEGSNTSVILGDRLFFKGYRRLQVGINPELEIGRYLTEHTSFANIIPVAGAVEYQRESGARTTLGLLQGYVANQGDAWSYTLAYLERFLDDCQLKTVDEEGYAPEETHVVYMNTIRTLGQRTGELHRALAEVTGNPDFDPEPIRPEEAKTWIERVRGETIDTLDRLAGVPDLPQPLAAQVERLTMLRSVVVEALSAMVPADIEAVKTRHHGDYHLGQVLVVENDFVIIDFEGEPARPLQERRAKHSALRDVAGMLRSFDYAAFAALERTTAERAGDFGFLEPFAWDWRRLTQQAFLEGYTQAVAQCPVYPRDRAQASGLIKLFVLEKALYEVRYELDNRPKWVAIPVQGILALFEPGQGWDKARDAES